jgi:hypothetical protein
MAVDGRKREMKNLENNIQRERERERGGNKGIEEVRKTKSK